MSDGDGLPLRQRPFQVRRHRRRPAPQSPPASALRLQGPLIPSSFPPLPSPPLQGLCSIFSPQSEGSGRLSPSSSSTYVNIRHTRKQPSLSSQLAAPADDAAAALARRPSPTPTPTPYINTINTWPKRDEDRGRAKGGGGVDAAWEGASLGSSICLDSLNRVSALNLFQVSATDVSCVISELGRIAGNPAIEHLS